MGTVSHKCSDPAANSKTCTYALFVGEDGTRFCKEHAPPEVKQFNQSTCTHTPRGGDVCPMCGARP
jgi:hypothetical protein